MNYFLFTDFRLFGNFLICFDSANLIEKATHVTLFWNLSRNPGKRNSSKIRRKMQNFMRKMKKIRNCGFGIPLHFSNYIWHHSGGRSGSDDVAITKTKIRMKKIHRKQRENNVCCKRRNIVLLWPPYSYFEHHKPQPQRNTRFINIHKTIKELEHTINFFNIIILSLT